MSILFQYAYLYVIYPKSAIATIPKTMLQTLYFGFFSFNLLLDYTTNCVYKPF